MDIKRILPHIIAVISFVVISIVYFYPQLQGKSIQSGDTRSYVGMANESKTFTKETGEVSLWTNSMFGGMPTYQIDSPRSNNIFIPLQTALSLGFARPISYFIFGCFSCYLMLLIFGVNPWLSLFGAIGFSFMTNNMVLFEAGHMSKMVAIFASPLIVGGLYALFREKYIAGALAFTLGLGLNITANHYQMTYYLAMLLAVYFVMEAVAKLRSGNTSALLKITGICVVATLIAVGVTASKLLPTYEYAHDTMRGAPILESTGAVQSSSETDGLDFNYAMAWSNGTIDLFSSFIPGVAGGGSREKLSRKSEFAKAVRKIGSMTDVGPLYWGALPSTSGPVYFGVVFFFLMLFGGFAIKGPIKWWVFIALFLTLLMSMGSNMVGLNRLMFDYLPLFNKFRTPNSVLSVTSVIIPVLGMLALQKVLDEPNKNSLIRPLLFSTGIMAIFCLFFALIGPGFFDFVGRSDASYAQSGFDKALVIDRKSLMRSDSLRSLLLTLIMAGGIYGYLKSKLSIPVLIAVFGVLTVFDQIGISKRYLDADSFVNSRSVNSDFAPRPVDTQILSDSDPHFRVFDQTIDPWNDSSTSYFHKTIGGYHAAKLQRIMDLIQRHISKGNQRVLNMMNTKYYIMPGENNAAEARLNTAALGNAWFINSIRMVENANAEIDALTGFDPAGEAIVHSEYANYVAGLNPTKNGTINLTSYQPNKLSYESNTTSDQLAVFSEMWYGPNKGWQAYIDGEKVDHIRANYALRALKIPSGKHTVTFIFDPAIYRIGNMISLIASIVFVLGSLGLIALWFKRRKETENNVIVETSQLAPTKALKKKAKSDISTLKKKGSSKSKTKSKKKVKKKNKPEK